MILSCSKGRFVTGFGKIVYCDFECRFYGIEASNGECYDPINLLPTYYTDGLQVYFQGVVRDDLASIHMWGTIIELTEINTLEKE
jgi:hypothetical protein